MPAVHRLGDPNTAGAAITLVAQGTVFVNGLLWAINGSQVAGHGRGAHAGPNTASGSGTVFIGGISVNFQGNADTCGHTRAGGSPDVFVDSSSSGSSSGSTQSQGAVEQQNTNVATSVPAKPGDSNADGFKSIAPVTIVKATSAMIIAVMGALAKADLIPEVDRLPYGGDDTNESGTSTGDGTISPSVLTTVDAWYVQKVMKATTDAGLTPAWPGLPFGGDDSNG